jgi:signal transduction histidine kinase
LLYEDFSSSSKREAIMRTEIQAHEEGLRMGAFSLTDALEAERQRIGMDLHDQTLADLTRIVELSPINSASCSHSC